MSLQEIMILWDQRLNTAEIAKKLGAKENEVLRCVEAGLERRRVQRVAEQMGVNV